MWEESGRKRERNVESVRERLERGKYEYCMV